MSAVEVWVSIGGVDVRAGTLYPHRRRGGSAESASFTYLDEYIANPHAYSLEPGLPLEAGAHQSTIGHPMFGAFGDCAPDRWGRTLVKRREAAQARAEGREPRSLGEVDYLLGVRDDLRQGALRFRHGDGPFEAIEDRGVPALTDLPELLDSRCASRGGLSRPAGPSAPHPRRQLPRWGAAQSARSRRRRQPRDCQVPQCRA